MLNFFHNVAFGADGSGSPGGGSDGSGGPGGSSGGGAGR